MVLTIYLVDAFAHRPFSGNPAAVVIDASGVDPNQMQDIASEMNQAETAFLVPNGDGYHLRWFTPTREVELCGHATLASAHVLYEEGYLPLDRPAVFHTLSGELQARRRDSGICMSFPAEEAEEIPMPPQVKAMFGKTVVWTGRNRMDLMVVLDDECTVRSFQPEVSAIASLGGRGLIVTAQSDEVDFVSRFFAPNYGVNEDSVTGSAHCCLGPYWSKRLAKVETVGYQASPRGGYVSVVDRGDRVDLSGPAVTVLRGEISL